MYQCVLACGRINSRYPGCYASRVTEAQRRDEAPGGPREPSGQDGIPRDGIIDLLGLLAYAELDAYFRLTEDAALAPSLADKAALGGMAVAEYGHFRLLCDQLTALGARPDQAMLPFAPALDAFHARTAPADWLEGLVKAYVGDAIAADFYRAVAELVNAQTRELVLQVLADTGHAEFVIARVRAAISADPQLGAGSRCGPGGWSGRRWPRPTGSSRTVVRWPACSPGPVPSRPVPPRPVPPRPVPPRKKRATLRPASSATSGGCWPG